MKKILIVLLMSICVTNAFAQFTVDANTVALWHMDETSGNIVSDATGNSNHGTAAGTTIMDGKFGKARRFNGTSSSYVSIFHNTSLNLTVFTIEAWVKYYGGPLDFKTIVAKRGPGVENYGVYIGGNGEIRFQFTQGVSNNTFLDSQIGVADDNWHYVACTYDGSQMKIYIDGNLSGSKAQSGLPDFNTANLMLGYTENGYNLDGIIDEVRISKIARTIDTSSSIVLTYNQIDASLFPTIKSYVTVTNASGTPITGLTSSNFVTKEDGTTESITVTPVGSTSSSIAVAITLDRSGSMTGQAFTDTKNAATTFINNLAINDKAAIISFASQITINQDFTSNKTLLLSAINSLSASGSTLLYDAIYQSVDRTRLQIGRKAVIILTDGDDTGSTKTKDQAINYAKQYSIPVFTIGLGTVNTQVLQDIANQTGGIYSYAPNSSQLAQIYNTISQQLNNQYLIQYNTHNSITDGSTRTVAITVNYNSQTDTKTKQYTAPTNGTNSIKPIASNNTYTKGTDFWIEVKVGDPYTVSNLYGISFKLLSNNSNCTYIDGSAENGGFLGTGSSVLFFTQKVTNQTVDIGISKTSGSGTNGSGIVARAKFTSSASISSDQTVIFSLSDITASNSTGGTILFSPSTLTITIKAIITVDVWPGDCDNNKVVNSADIIPIGLYYGQTRPGSNNPGNSWQAYPREPWTSDGSTPKRIYADANGDGTINSADIIPIGLNYSKFHTSIQNDNNEIVNALHKTNTDANIKPIINSPVKNNTVFQVQVKIGDPNLVQNLYGISFKLQSNKSTCTYIDGSAENVGFLGTGSSVLFFPQKVNNQTVDIGISKTSGVGVSGSGILARAQFISSIDQVVTFSLIDVVAIDHNGNSIPLTILPSDVSVDVKKQNVIPTEFILSQNYPNPFNPTTAVRFGLPDRTMTKLMIYDALGREITTLVNGELDAGYHEINFNSENFASGVYFYRIEASNKSGGNFTQTKKMVILR